MHVAVDGQIFETQTTGGISRIYRTVLPLMCELDPNLRISLYLARSSRQKLTLHPSIQMKRILPLDSRGLARTGLDSRQRRNLALTLGVRGAKETIWHSTYYSQPFYWAGPKVVMVYDLIYFFFSQDFARVHDDIFRRAMEQAIRTADVVLCISAVTAQDLATHLGVSPQKLRVVHLAAGPQFKRVDAVSDEQNTNDVIPTAKPFLLYVGGRHGYKNFAILLDAYARWPRRTEVDLVAVGDAWSQSEAEALQTKRIQANVHLCSGLSDEHLNRLYNRALAFVYPSLYEGFGIPLLEAMAAGCPIIASDIPSSREIARDYPVFFDPMRVESLLAALDHLWDRPPQPAELQYGQHIAAQYSWEQTAREIVRHYYEVADLDLPSALRRGETGTPDGR